jgi:hypothetical protein
MVETTRNESSADGADLAAAARDRGMEQIEGAKGRLAEGAERVADAVERTADELESDGDNAISGFGRSVASVMRQLAGGLRERDVEEFARELSALARRNPGVFLAGSVALGFGIARFFKAHAPQARGDSRGSYYGDGSQYAGARSMNGWRDSSASDWQGASVGSASGWRDASSSGGREDFDGDDSLDLSSSSTARRDEVNGGDRADETGGASTQHSGASLGSAMRQEPSRDGERNQGKSRQSGKQKAKGQRASGAGEDSPPTSPDRQGGQS